MRLLCAPVRDLCEFERVGLTFSDARHQSVFANKNNKTLGETVKHRRYSNLKNDVTAKYPGSLDKPLGSFLLGLKSAGDPFYKRFLNR